MNVMNADEIFVPKISIRPLHSLHELAFSKDIYNSQLLVSCTSRKKIFSSTGHLSSIYLQLVGYERVGMCAVNGDTSVGTWLKWREDAALLECLCVLSVQNIWNVLSATNCVKKQKYIKSKAHTGKYQPSAVVKLCICVC